HAYLVILDPPQQVFAAAPNAGDVDSVRRGIALVAESAPGDLRLREPRTCEYETKRDQILLHRPLLGVRQITPVFPRIGPGRKDFEEVLLKRLNQLFRGGQP